MSRRRAKAHPCPTATKTGWGTQALAEEALAVILEQPDEWREKLPCRAYRCPCGRWHLTSAPGDDSTPAVPPPVPSHAAAIARVHAVSASSSLERSV